LEAIQRKPLLTVAGVTVVLCAALIVYARAWAFAWDEGFHLLTAQLIMGGKRPYLDFFFPQAPLNAYWNAGWMRLFGDTWRAVHTVAAVMTSGAVFLTAHFVVTRLPIVSWRLAGALFVIVLTGLNALIDEFGSIGQSYALSLFLILAAFHCAIRAVAGKGLLWAAGTGFCAAAAAGATLLVASAAPVLLLWMMIYNRAGKRVVKFAAFVAGAVIPTLPILRLYLASPRVVRFDMVEYHMFYRLVEWDGAAAHDADIFTVWVNCPQALILLILGVVGLRFIMFKSYWDVATRSQYYLCAWLASAISLHVSTAHPTFSRYYLYSVPFLSILAVPGLYVIGSRFVPPEQPRWPVLFVSALAFASLARYIYMDRVDALSWNELEQLAKKIEEVTPRNEPIFGDEQMYFLTRRPVPSGMESADSHKLTLAPELAKSVHVLSKADLIKEIAAGQFATAESCDSDEIDKLGLSNVYAKKFDVKDCSVFWEKKPPAAASK
jgi:hypothetical protein